jgi:DNA-binding NarL/FixJ family response regulator
MMTVRVLSAVGSDMINNLLENRDEFKISNDIPYQEGLFDFLKKEQVDVLILNVELQGIYNKFGVIEKIREIDSSLKIIAIIDKEDFDYKNYLASKGIFEVLIHDKSTIDDLVNAIMQENKKESVKDLQTEIINLKKMISDKTKTITETRIIPKIQKQEIITVAGGSSAGKSTFVCQIANLLAQKSSSKILVIDLDIVQPSIENFFGIDSLPENIEFIMEYDKACVLNCMVDAIDRRIFDRDI